MSEQVIELRVIQAADALIRGENANWDLARLTYLSTRGRVGRPRSDDGRISMDEWCRRIRERSGRAFSASTGNLYRSIWEQTQNSRDSGNTPSWSEAYWEARGTTAEQSFGHIHGKNAVENLDNLEPEAKQALADRLMDDPDTAQRMERKFVEKAGSDPGLVSKVNRQYEEYNPAPEKPARETGGLDLVAYMSFGADIYSFVQSRQDKLNEITRFINERGHEMTTGQREAMGGVVETLEQTRGLISQYEDALRGALGIDADATFRRLMNNG